MMDAIKQAIEALETAESGLRWYIDMCPQFARECDDEALAEIDAALSALRAQQDTKDEHIVWCGCGDEIVQGSGAKCGTCAAIDTMCPGVSGEDTKDGERFAWYFSDEPKGDFLSAFMQGVREHWSLDQWRAAIDAARGADRADRT
jgi:hypothetical protein